MYCCLSQQHEPVMWSETVGLRTRPVRDQKIGLGLVHCSLGLGLAHMVLFCETQSYQARRHNESEGHSNFSSTISSFSILCLEHHYCGDQQCRSLT